MCCAWSSAVGCLPRRGPRCGEVLLLGSNSNSDSSSGSGAHGAAAATAEGEDGQQPQGGPTDAEIEASSHAIRQTAADLDNQRVIKCDAERTRADCETFREPQTQALLINILTYYCKTHHVRYKQGMNEILAPFVLLRQPAPLPEHTLYEMLASFVKRYLTHMFSDDEFQSLQAAFRLFRLVLLYHDPELTGHLDQFEIVPELFATSWFLTLFAQLLPIESLFQTWEAYLLDVDHGQFLHTFVSIAYLCANRSVFLEAHSSDLPISLTSALRSAGPLALDQSRLPASVGGSAESDDQSQSLTILSSPGVTDVLLERARALMRETPRALRIALRRALFEEEPPSAEDVARLEEQPCLTALPSEVVESVAGALRLLVDDDGDIDEAAGIARGLEDPSAQLHCIGLSATSRV